MGDEITRLREKIAALDHSLLELLEKRFGMAANVGRLKAERGEPVVARDVEERVLARAREAADLCDASPEVMEGIFTAIIRGSVERQHRVGVRMKARGGAKALIIGAAGGMGDWFRRFLESIGHETAGVDPAWAGEPPSRDRFPSLESVPDMSAYDALFLAIPLESTEELLTRLSNAPPGPPVIEISSIKSTLRHGLLAMRRKGIPALSIHPMFGPSKNLYEPLTIVHAVLEDEQEERATILNLLAHPYMKIVSIPFSHHDRLMGWLLGLSHLTGMLFANALAHSGLDPEELWSVASTSFVRQVATSRSVLQANNPELYFAIQRLNPFRGEVYAAMNDALEEFSDAVETDDRDRFSAAFELGAKQLPKTDR